MKKTAALVLVVTIILTVAACGVDGNGFGNAPDLNVERSERGNNPSTQDARQSDLPETPAEDFEYAYDAENGGVVIERYTGSSLRVRIPEEIEGFPVIEIGDRAFADSSIAEVYIPGSVARIGSDAFRSCSSLASVTISDGVTYIGGETFRYCRSLTSITIPDSVTFIGAYAFSNCSSLTSVTVPDNADIFGSRDFNDIGRFYGVDTIANISFGGRSVMDGDTEFDEWMEILTQNLITADRRKLGYVFSGIIYMSSHLDPMQAPIPGKGLVAQIKGEEIELNEMADLVRAIRAFFGDEDYFREDRSGSYRIYFDNTNIRPVGAVLHRADSRSGEYVGFLPENNDLSQFTLVEIAIDANGNPGVLRTEGW